MKLLSFLFLVFLTSCVTSKPYTWDGKKVTENKYNKELMKFTKNYVKESSHNIGDFRLIYDTIQGKD